MAAQHSKIRTLAVSQTFLHCDVTHSLLDGNFQAHIMKVSDLPSFGVVEETGPCLIFTSSFIFFCPQGASYPSLLWFTYIKPLGDYFGT